MTNAAKKRISRGMKQSWKRRREFKKANASLQRMEKRIEKDSKILVAVASSSEDAPVFRRRSKGRQGNAAMSTVLQDITIQIADALVEVRQAKNKLFVLRRKFNDYIQDEMVDSNDE